MLQRIQFLTAGESHGKGLLGILEGIPAGLPVREEDIALQLKRRQHGHGRGGRMKIEQDRAEIYAGVRHGRTLGSPIGLLLPNRDWENWQQKMAIDQPEEMPRAVTLPRPGHADLAGVQKYDLTDIRNVLERASARETAMRVALAAICRLLLKEVDIKVGSRVVQIHTVQDTTPLPQDLDLDELNQQAERPFPKRIRADCLTHDPIQLRLTPRGRDRASEIGPDGFCQRQLQRAGADDPRNL